METRAWLLYIHCNIIWQRPSVLWPFVCLFNGWRVTFRRGRRHFCLSVLTIGGIEAAPMLNWLQFSRAYIQRHQTEAGIHIYTELYSNHKGRCSWMNCRKSIHKTPKILFWFWYLALKIYFHSFYSFFFWYID